MNVVITGASSGIGRALAVVFAREGHAVLAVARREDRLRALCDEIANANAVDARYMVLDLTAQSAPSDLLDEAIRVFGEVHALVNCAGMSPYQEFQELDREHLRHTLILNALVLTELCHAFIAHMLCHGEPSHLVNVGSVGGYTFAPNFSVYCGTKHYVRVFTDLLHHELRDTNIRVSGLHPGGTFSEFQELAGQRIQESARSSMMAPEAVAERAYPAIVRGKRVIVMGLVNRFLILVGKLLPFSWAIRVMEAIYRRSVEKVPPTYPLAEHVEGDGSGPK